MTKSKKLSKGGVYTLIVGVVLLFLLLISPFSCSEPEPVGYVSADTIDQFVELDSVQVDTLVVE